MLPETIVFVTSSNLATNPRCLKEIQLALRYGIQVKIMACKLNGWSQKNEALLQQSLVGAEIKYVGENKDDKSKWLLSTLMEKFDLQLYKLLNNRALRIIAYGYDKRSYLLLNQLNKTDWKPTLVIAHNPAAFYPAYSFAKKRSALYAIDVEDYHPGENQPLIKQQLVRQLMQQLLSKVDYSTYASPLIFKKVMQEIRLIHAKRSFVINNLFMSREFGFKEASDTKNLKLVWFSQNIDYKRGLEKILQALDCLDISLTLTLIGNAREPFARKELNHRMYIHLVNPLPQPELHKYLSNFDVGLAVEDSHADVNRTLCLTNKIWAYFQAGLFIIATETAAQKEFMQQFPKHGMLVKDDPNSYKTVLNTVEEQWKLLNKNRFERFESAKEHSWDIESEKLAKVWSEIMK